MNVDFSWLEVDSLRKELENGSGFSFFSNPVDESVLLSDPKNYFLELSKRIGFPLSQSIHGERILDVRDRAYSKKISGHGVPTPTENSASTLIVAM